MQTNLENIPSFNPPFWCRNGHYHTIARSLFSNVEKPPSERIKIETPDDDFLELDVIRHATNKPVIALFHGLEGSSERYYITELIKQISAKGWSAVAINFRSCGSRMNHTPRFYHSGATDDYITVLNWMKNTFPSKSLGAVGFSLGGNALLKYLGEEKNTPLRAAAAISVPYDLKAGSIRINQGFNRLYEYRFLRTLRRKLYKKRGTFPDLPTFSGSTLYEFDNQVTAPVHGFDDADDYYQQCSSAQFISSIQTQVLLIHSREDPLCPIENMPLNTICENPETDYIITRQGGHVGFWDKNKDWLNTVILNYFQRNLIDNI